MPPLERELAVAPYPDHAEKADERFRNVLGRSLIFGSPLMAAACAVSFRSAFTTGGLPIASREFLFLVNAAVAVFGSAAGVAVLRGRLSVKVGGSLAYGTLSLIVYGLIVLTIWSVGV
ncbi:MAG: hypothetical protein H0T47_02765 [Planctomycetaceae bacterium]|nr:hypothetical protein [Planctomycetaceae bacterium]